MTNNKVKATEEPTLAVGPEELSLAELQAKLADLEAKLNAKEQEVDQLKQRDEGYLVWTPNPSYDGLTCGVMFANGMAFIPKNRKFTMFDGSAKMLVDYLKNDFGYSAQYFTKEQSDELKVRLSDRAKERADMIAKFGDAKEQLEQMLNIHHL